MTTTARAARHTLRDAINGAIRQALIDDDRVIVIGEDVAGGAGMEQYENSSSLGGVFGVTKGLVEEFGRERVIDTPLAETALMGTAVGAAANGLRPIVELMFVDFLGTCLDPIMNQGSRLHYMSNGQIRVPLVIRTTYGAGLGAGPHHSGSYYAIFAHLPGIKVVVPSNAADARDLFAAAVADDDIVIFFENTAMYGVREAVAAPRALELGRAEVKREGDAVTVVSIGAMVPRALKAAEELVAEGVEAEVIDLMSIVPLDLDTVVASVQKTGRLVVVDEDNPRCSVASDLIAQVLGAAFDSVKSAPVHVGPPQVPVPYGPDLESAYLPSKEDIAEAVRNVTRR